MANIVNQQFFLFFFFYRRSSQPGSEEKENIAPPCHLRSVLRNASLLTWPLPLTACHFIAFQMEFTINAMSHPA